MYSPQRVSQLSDINMDFYDNGTGTGLVEPFQEFIFMDEDARTRFDISDIVPRKTKTPKRTTIVRPHCTSVVQDERVCLEVELPGVERRDVTVAVLGRRINVSGIRYEKCYENNVRREEGKEKQKTDATRVSDCTVEPDDKLDDVRKDLKIQGDGEESDEDRKVALLLAGLSMASHTDEDMMYKEKERQVKILYKIEMQVPDKFDMDRVYVMDWGIGLLTIAIPLQKGSLCEKRLLPV